MAISSVAAERPASAVSLPRSSLSTVLIGALMLYFPLAHVPPAKYLRTNILRIPVLDSPNQDLFSLGIVLLPEMLVVLLIAIALLWEGRLGRPSGHSGTRVALITVAGLILFGSSISYFATDYPAISAAGLVARMAMLLLAWLILKAEPTYDTARLWTYLSLGGGAAMCVLGIVFFVSSFGVPTSLSLFPLLRLDPRFQEYERATYGHSSVTASYLVMAFGVSFALLWSRGRSLSARIFLGVVTVLVLINLLIAFQRWAWICVLVTIAAVILYWRANLRSGGLVALLLVVTALVGDVVITQLGSYFDDALALASGSNLALRQDLWREGFDVFLANPLGYGLGTVGRIVGLSATSSHNIFIDIAIEGGIAAALGFIFWTVVHTFWTLRLLARPQASDDLPFALLLGTTMFVLYGMFFNSELYVGGNIVWLASWFAFPAIAIAMRNDPSIAEGG